MKALERSSVDDSLDDGRLSPLPRSRVDRGCDFLLACGMVPHDASSLGLGVRCILHSTLITATQK